MYVVSQVCAKLDAVICAFLAVGVYGTTRNTCHLPNRSRAHLVHLANCWFVRGCTNKVTSIRDMQI